MTKKAFWIAMLTAGLLTVSAGATLADGAAEADGAALYAKKCALCHGADGTAKAMWAKKGMKNLNDPALQKERTDEDLIKVTTEGIPEKKMPAYKDKLSTEEIAAIVKYIRTLAPSE